MYFAVIISKKNKKYLQTWMYDMCIGAQLELKWKNYWKDFSWKKRFDNPQMKGVKTEMTA